MAGGVPAGRGLERARWAVFVVFMTNGFLFASWVPRVAEVRDRLGVGEGAMGLALLSLAAGALLAMPLAGWAADRWGTRVTIGLSAALLGLSLPLPGLATTVPELAVALLLTGVASGALDVSMNVQGAVVEQRLGRRVFAGFHGGFSLGGLLGAATAALLAGAGFSPLEHFVAVGPAVGLLGAAMSLFMLRSAQPAGEGHGHGGLGALSGVLLPGVIAFCCLMAEGSVGDWSAILLADWRDAGPTVAGAAFAAFNGAMAAGRLLGDRVIARLGDMAVLRGGGALAAAGLGVVLLVDSAAAAVAGFTLAGAGLSCIFPVCLNLGARLMPSRPGAAIAAVSTLGYGGLLAGPPLIGLLAAVTTLPLAMGLVALLVAGIPALTLGLPRRAVPA